MQDILNFVKIFNNRKIYRNMQKRNLPLDSNYYGSRRLLTKIQKYERDKNMKLHWNPHSGYYVYNYTTRILYDSNISHHRKSNAKCDFISTLIVFTENVYSSLPRENLLCKKSVNRGFGIFWLRKISALTWLKLLWDTHIFYTINEK